MHACCVEEQTEELQQSKDYLVQAAACGKKTKVMVTKKL
jgi:hypothetical protein